MPQRNKWKRSTNLTWKTQTSHYSKFNKKLITTFSNTNINRLGGQQAGGTCLITTSKFLSRQRQPASDIEEGLGRWSTATYQGSQGYQLTILIGYSVCRTSIKNPGPTTTYKQQWSIQRTLGDEKPDPHIREILWQSCRSSKTTATSSSSWENMTWLPSTWPHSSHPTATGRHQHTPKATSGLITW